jgi:isoleucyl-tRNA synthetase
VDNNGNFDGRVGESLEGLPAMTGGNLAIIAKLKQRILKQEKYEHSYPYDWRTKKPVLIKTSMQWFINTDSLKNLAAVSLYVMACLYVRRAYVST